MNQQLGGRVRRFGTRGEILVMTILAGMISTAYAQSEAPPPICRPPPKRSPLQRAKCCR